MAPGRIDVGVEGGCVRHMDGLPCLEIPFLHILSFLCENPGMWGQKPTKESIWVTIEHDKTPEIACRIAICPRVNLSRIQIRDLLKIW